jgi:hypothetical protein
MNTFTHQREAVEARIDGRRAIDRSLMLGPARMGGHLWTRAESFFVDRVASLLGHSQRPSASANSLGRLLLAAGGQPRRQSYSGGSPAATNRLSVWASSILLAAAVRAAPALLVCAKPYAAASIAPASMAATRARV